MNYKIINSRNEYGGRVYTLEFEEPPTGEQLRKVVNDIDCFNFGYRIVGGECGVTKIISVKIHND